MDYALPLVCYNFVLQLHTDDHIAGPAVRIIQQWVLDGFMKTKQPRGNNQNTKLALHQGN